MSRSRVERDVIALLRERAFAGSDRPIRPDDRLGADGLGLDSLAMVEFVVAFEKRFKVTVPDDVWAAAEELRVSHFIERAAGAATAGGVPAGLPRPAAATLMGILFRVLALLGVNRPR